MDVFGNKAENQRWGDKDSHCFQDFAFSMNINPHSFEILYVDFFIQLFLNF